MYFSLHSDWQLETNKAGHFVFCKIHIKFRSKFKIRALVYYIHLHVNLICLQMSVFHFIFQYYLRKPCQKRLSTVVFIENVISSRLISSPNYWLSLSIYIQYVFVSMRSDAHDDVNQYATTLTETGTYVRLQVYTQNHTELQINILIFFY